MLTSLRPNCLGNGSCGNGICLPCGLNLSGSWQQRKRFWPAKMSSQASLIKFVSRMLTRYGLRHLLWSDALLAVCLLKCHCPTPSSFGFKNKVLRPRLCWQQQFKISNLIILKMFQLIWQAKTQKYVVIPLSTETNWGYKCWRLGFQFCVMYSLLLTRP